MASMFASFFRNVHLFPEGGYKLHHKTRLGRRPFSFTSLCKYNLDKYCPLELSSMMEMFCIFAVQYGGH